MWLEFFFTVNIVLRLTVKILSFLRLTAKFLAVLWLTVNPIETLLNRSDRGGPGEPGIIGYMCTVPQPFVGVGKNGVGVEW